MYFRLQRALEINQLIKIMQIIIVNLATGHLSQNWHGRGISFAIVPDHYYSWWQLKTLIVNRKLPICWYIEKHYWYKTICLSDVSQPFFKYVFCNCNIWISNNIIYKNRTLSWRTKVSIVVIYPSYVNNALSALYMIECTKTKRAWKCPWQFNFENFAVHFNNY